MAITINAIIDATGEFFLPLREAFPDVTSETWSQARERDPQAFAGEDTWRLVFRCYLIVTDQHTILVDAGVGPATAPATWAPLPGSLPERLEVAPSDIDIVVLTHLHTDHVGWAVSPTAFRNARHVVQRVEHDTIVAAGSPLRDSLLEPLRATGQLELVDGTAALATGVRTQLAPGHTPGHQVVLVERGSETVAVAGDAFVHAVQLVDPSVAYRYEDDPAEACRTRQSLLAQADVLATAHLTEPFHRLR